MKSKELLFELIHSLSKSEKRYFKVFTSGQKENNNYIKLFDAILKQNKYNEKELLIQFKNEDFVRQFSVAKNYLMNLILKSLSNHHQKAKKSIELNEYLTEIEILFWKGLYKLAYKKIKQAQKVAKKYELTLYLLIINHWSGRVEDYVSKEMYNELSIKENQKLVDEYGLEMQMKSLIKKMEQITKSTIKSTKETQQPVLEIFSHPLMQGKFESILSFHSKLDYLFLKGIGYSILGNDEKEFYYKKKLIDFLEENPHQIKENPIRYAGALNNILLLFYFQGYTDEYPDYLEKLDNVDVKFYHAKNSFFDTNFNLKLGYYLYKRDTKLISGLLAEMEEWYEEIGPKKRIQSKMISEYNMSLSYFYLKNYKRSLYWCNSCFNLFDLKAKKYRHDLATSTLTIQILIYYELEHFDLGLKYLDLLLDIAKVNKYESAEMEIFYQLKKILAKAIKNDKEAIIKLSEIVTKQNTKLINIDKDVIVFWLESKTG